jgi:hypothetical protein
MIGDADESMVMDYQNQRLREKAAPKTTNEEVGFLLRLLGDRGELIRSRLRKQRSLKLKAASSSREFTRPKSRGSWSTLRTTLAHRRSTRR